MDTPATLRFATMARLLADECRRHGVQAPDFRSPPGLLGADRTVRHRPGGQPAVVSVRLRSRPFAAVVADMVEGVVAANRLSGPQASRLRAALWSVAAGALTAAA